MNTNPPDTRRLARRFEACVLACALAALAAATLAACEREADDEPVGGVETPMSSEREDEMASDVEGTQRSAPATMSDPSALDSAGCGELGPLTQRVDDAGGPLLVSFSVPEGFEQVMSESDTETVVVHRVERQVGEHHFAIEVVQGRDAHDPTHIAEELAPMSSGELDYNVPAGTTAFGEQQLEVYRSEKDDGRIYTLAVPGGSGGEQFLTTLYVTSVDPVCRPQMQALADQVLASMAPSPAPQLVTQD